MADLHINITGDCTGATTALANTKAAAADLQGTRAEVITTVTGTQATVRGLQSVSAAREAAGGTVMVGVDTGGLDAGVGSLRGFRAEVRGATGDLDAASGLRSFGFADDGSIGRATAGLGSMTQGLQGVRGASVGVMDDASSSAGRASESFQGARASTDSATEGLGQFSDAGDVAATRGERFGGTIGAANSEIQAMNGNVQTLSKSSSDLSSALGDVQNSAGGSGSLEGAFNSFNQANAGASRNAGRGSPVSGTGGDVPPRERPPAPPGGDDGSGGLGDLFGEGGGGFGKAARGVLQPAMMGTMIGVGAVAVTAAAGFEAVSKTVAAIPGLSFAAAKAQYQLGEGIRSGAAGALAEGVPAYKELGKAMHGLGDEVGHIGAQQIGNVIGDETSLTKTGTQALKNLEPAIGPSLAGMTAVAGSALKGVTAPETVQSIAGAGNAMADPKNQKGIEASVGGLVHIAAQTAAVAADVVGAVGPALGGGGPTGAAASGDQWWSKPVGSMISGQGSPFSYDPGKDKGDVPLPGMDGGVSWNQHSMFGTGMTALGATGSLIGTTAKDIVTGSAFTGAGASELHRAGDDFNQRMGRAITPGGADQPDPGTPASAGGRPTSAGAFPQGTSARYGWDMDKQGNLTPSHGPGGGGGTYSGGPQRQPQAPQPSFRGTGPGSSIGPVPSQIAQLGQASGTASPRVSQLGQQAVTAGQQAAQLGQHAGVVAPQVSQMNQHAAAAVPQMQRLNQSSNQMSQLVQQLGQNSTVATSHLSQFGQNTTTAASQVSQLGSTVKPALQSLQQVPQQTSSAMNQASSTIQSGGSQLGAQMPDAMAQGISANTGAACTAAADLGQSAADCGASALQSQSPSRKFVSLGEGIPQGLAIGVGNTAGDGAASVGAAMTGAVAAGTGAVASGLSGAMATASAGVQGVASDSGLGIGYSWAESVVSGAQSVIQKANFQSLGFPQVESQLAKAALGALGMLGPAGSGAETYQTQSSLVTMGGSGPSSPLNPQFQVQVMLNSEPFENVATKVVQTNMNQLADSISRQRG